MALILERESQKWFRPVRDQFRMTYRLDHKMHEYQPDFVAELEAEILMLEVKAQNEMGNPEVLEKARVAREWCEAASKHVGRSGGKPWRYAVIPHSDVALNKTLPNLTGSG